MCPFSKYFKHSLPLLLRVQFPQVYKIYRTIKTFKDFNTAEETGYLNQVYFKVKLICGITRKISNININHGIHILLNSMLQISFFYL